MVINENVMHMLSEISAKVNVRVVNTSSNAAPGYMPVHTCVMLPKREHIDLLDVSQYLYSHNFSQQATFAGSHNVRPLFFTHNDGSFAVINASQDGELVSITVQWMAD